MRDVVIINNHNVLFQNNDEGKFVVSSRDVAGVFGKQHKNILRDIKALPQDDFGRLNFEPTYYVDQWNREKPEYLLTRDGFSLLVMGFTGEKAYQWKVEFIKAFNKMEEYIRQGQSNFSGYHEIEQKKLELERARLLKEYSDNYRNKFDGRYSQILDSYAIKELVGENILPLPERDQHYYTATEVGQKLGVSACRVGKIANKYGLKIDEYGKWFMDKARNSSKEVENFRYNEKGLRAIEECLEKDKPTDITSYMMTDILQLQH